MSGMPIRGAVAVTRKPVRPTSTRRTLAWGLSSNLNVFVYSFLVRFLLKKKLKITLIVALISGILPTLRDMILQGVHNSEIPRTP